MARNAKSEAPARSGHAILTEADLPYLRSVCPAAEFEEGCMVALRLTAMHYKRDRARGQATGRAEQIALLEREAAAVHVLLARWGHEPALRAIRQKVHFELEVLRSSSKRGGKHALHVAAALVVSNFVRCGLAVDTSMNERGAVAVLRLICERAGMPLSLSSYKAAIRQSLPINNSAGIAGS